MNINQTKIGKRIKSIRKNKGYSQEDLAKVLKLSRTAVTQIELGNRNLSIIELIKIAEFLNFPLERILSDKFELTENIKQTEKVAKDNIQQMRISVPRLNVAKFKNVLLYILEQCAGKPNIGETALYKLLYFSDFNYYEIYENQLTGARYRKLPYGPVPQKLDAIFTQMISAKQIQKLKTEYHGYPQTRYLPLEKADLTKFSASEKEVIDNVINQFSDWSAKAISEFSHKDIPWLTTEDGKDIDYELTFYREPPYSVRNYDDGKEEL